MIHGRLSLNVRTILHIKYMNIQLRVMAHPLSTQALYIRIYKFVPLHITLVIKHF